MARRHADVIVVGAGVLGTFHAHFAARKGLSVLLIERNALPNDASVRNFGMIAPSIVDPAGAWAPFARASAEVYRAIQREMDVSVRATGSLYVASTALEDAVLREFMALHGADYRCAYLEAGAALTRYPFVRESYCAGALLFPDDLTVDPPRLLERLIAYVTRDGRVRYLPHTTVVAVERSGQDCAVRDAAGHALTAGRVVICSGADYRTLFPDLFRGSGLRVCKLQMMRTEPVSRGYLPHAILSGLSIRRYPAFTSCPSYELLRADPLEEDLRAFGIHLLFKQDPDGGVVIGDSHEYRDCADASGLEERTGCAINEAILRYARGMLHLPSWEPQHLWNGYYLAHPDLPIYTHQVDEGIHVVTGIGGKGMTTGPGFARHSIDTIVG